MTTVPKLWPGSTIVCIGSGPSLTREDVEYCRGKARVIVVNDSYRLAPWADVLYACDDKWWGWHWHKGARDFTGLKYSLTANVGKFPGVVRLRNTGDTGIEMDPSGLRTGKNSGYQAMNLAVHLGAAKILLLGYDMQGDHWFGSHPNKSKPPFAMSLMSFKTMVEPLRVAGVEVMNCSRATALRVFPRGTLEAQLVQAEVSA